MYCVDPVSIGYSVDNIVPDGNVINNFIILVGPPPTEAPRKRQIEEGEEPLFFLARLSCYSTRGYENPEWKVPDGNGSEAYNVANVSLYETELIINPSLFPENYVGRVVCETSNGFVNSSVIVAIRKY